MGRQALAILCVQSNNERSIVEEDGPGSVRIGKETVKDLERPGPRSQCGVHSRAFRLRNLFRGERMQGALFVTTATGDDDDDPCRYGKKVAERVKPSEIDAHLDRDLCGDVRCLLDGG